MEYDNSILGRQPKIPPAIAFLGGMVCIPLGYGLQGSIGGGLMGAGIALLVMSSWDFIRLRLHARRQARQVETPDKG